MNRRDLVTKLPFLGVLPLFQFSKAEKQSSFGVVPTDEDVERIYQGLLKNVKDRQLNIVYPSKININITKSISQKNTNCQEIYYSKIYLACSYILYERIDDRERCIFAYANHTEHDKLFDPTILFNRLMERFQPVV